MTNARPVSLGRLSKNRSIASSPPAEAPIPTTWEGAGDVPKATFVLGLSIFPEVKHRPYGGNGPSCLLER